MSVMSRGDTIIEVLLAITVFSLVAVGAITIMNQGTNATQRALEITLVRQEIDAQAEAIRAAQQATTTSDPAQTAWSKITGSNTSHFYDTPANESACPTPTTLPVGSFVLDPRTATAVTAPNWFKNINGAGAPPYAQLTYAPTVQSYGIWVERDYTPAAGKIPAIYSFLVHGCWFGAGLSHPLHIQTVVRLYDPGS